MTKKLNLDDKIFFGKYKGKKISYIIEIDPFYAKWLYEKNKNMFNLSDTCISQIYEKTYNKTFLNMCNRINKTKIKLI